VGIRALASITRLNDLFNPIAGYFGHNSYITQQFLRACEAIGIPSSPDVNTSKGTLGATKVIRICSLDQPRPHPCFVDKFRQAVCLRAITLTSRSVTFIDPKGRRVTAENAYLTPEVLKRPNLSVFVSAVVTKVILDKSNDRPRAVGVEFTSSRDGPKFEVRAKREVILW
jgi:choline dehydrogenase